MDVILSLASDLVKPAHTYINEDPWTLYRYHLVEMRPAVGLSRDTLLRERFPRIIGNARLPAVFYSGITTPPF